MNWLHAASKTFFMRLSQNPSLPYPPMLYAYFQTGFFRQDNVYRGFVWIKLGFHQRLSALNSYLIVAAFSNLFLNAKEHVYDGRLDFTWKFLMQKWPAIEGMALQSVPVCSGLWVYPLSISACASLFSRIKFFIRVAASAWTIVMSSFASAVANFCIKLRWKNQLLQDHYQQSNLSGSMLFLKFYRQDYDGIKFPWV